MTRRMADMTVALLIALMCSIDVITTATTGYFYDQPIKSFNLQPYSALRSTGPYGDISIGQKVSTSSRQRLTVPPLPKLPPLTTLIASGPNTKHTGYNPQSSQRGQRQQLPQQKSNQILQLKSSNSPYPTTRIPIQSKSNPIPTVRLTSKQPLSSPPSQPTLRSNQTPNTTPKQTTLIPARLTSTTTTSLPQPPPKLSISNSTQAGLGIASAPGAYIVDGRQLKQYEVHEQIDNDISQNVQNFIPANFFVSNYHARISDTHPLASDFQVQSRSSRQRFQTAQQQQNTQQQVQQVANSVAIGSGGLGFVKLPNGNIYLGSGSLGYISSLQRLQDVEEARTRTEAASPDALHFGHGSLSDSLYFQ